MSLTKISAVIITLNEEHLLGSVLQSLAELCNEIIVVDSGSTDRTVEIAEKYNCKVYYKKFEGYGNQKRYAVSLATNDWILSIDGDEVMTPELKDEIVLLFNKEPIQYDGIYVPITSVFMGKIFTYGNEYKKKHLRLFNKSNSNFDNSPLHEKVKVKGELYVLKNHLLHYSYKNLASYFVKFNHYSTVTAQNKMAKKEKVTILTILFIGPWTFFHQYLIRFNFLNGFPGFIWALFSSYFAVVKYTKLYELIRINKK
jgi:glycosyltransferase involved in cell wall biosynthesis